MSVYPSTSRFWFKRFGAARQKNGTPRSICFGTWPKHPPGNSLQTWCILLALSVSSGCSVREGWVKPGATDQDRKVALYECERDARIAEGGPAMFRRCMDSKGYIQQK